MNKTKAANLPCTEICAGPSVAVEKRKECKILSGRPTPPRCDDRMQCRGISEITHKWPSDTSTSTASYLWYDKIAARLMHTVYGRWTPLQTGASNAKCCLRIRILPEALQTPQNTSAMRGTSCRGDAVFHVEYRSTTTLQHLPRNLPPRQS